MKRAFERGVASGLYAAHSDGVVRPSAEERRANPRGSPGEAPLGLPPGRRYRFIAALTRSGVIGIRNRRAPTASKIALATTAPIGTMAGSPPPCAGRSRARRRCTVSIFGSHEKRGSS